MKYSVIIKSLAVISAIALTGAFAGCSKKEVEKEESSTVSVVSEQSVDPRSPDALVGKWQSERLPDYVYTFNSDRTGQYDMAGKVLRLTYSAEDGRITIKFLEEGYTPVTLNYVLEKDRLNIQDSLGKDTFYVKVKA